MRRPKRMEMYNEEDRVKRKEKAKRGTNQSQRQRPDEIGDSYAQGDVPNEIYILPWPYFSLDDLEHWQCSDGGESTKTIGVKQSTSTYDDMERILYSNARNG